MATHVTVSDLQGGGAFPDAQAFGFIGNERDGWGAQTRGGPVHFRILRTLQDLEHAERLQELVFEVTPRDLIPANELVVVAETGGVVLGAFLPDDPDTAVGVLVGWGGFVDKPRIVSDFMAVLPQVRNFGLAETMKRLQAAYALAHGFQEIVWTVEPLRAANARLNFGKLGAESRHYELDRYGTGFAAGLYGDMPTDRLHVTWEITRSSVLARLLGQPPAPISPGDDAAPECSAGMRGNHCHVPIPADIDALLRDDPDGAVAWRMRVREALIAAFADGFVVAGFQAGSEERPPALLLSRAGSR
jgi:predicted GNAT superfamily acetyltransferase